MTRTDGQLGEKYKFAVILYITVYTILMGGSNNYKQIGILEHITLQIVDDSTL